MALVSTRVDNPNLDPETRFSTMNLTAGGVCTMTKAMSTRGRTVFRPSTRDTVGVADIDGAQPYNRISHLTGKPDHHNVTDIAGTSSMRLHKDTNKPDRNLFHDDIEGSFPRKHSFQNRGRQVDPLNPQYKLPSYKWVPPPTPKFTRDSYKVDDILGTKPAPLFKYQQRDSYRVDDIEGTKPGWKPSYARARREAPPTNTSLDVRDITHGGFETSRRTNPLMPVYTCNGMTHTDDPVYTHPRCLPKAHNSPFYSLTTADIEGARAGWKPPTLMQPCMENRRHFRNTNFTGDIPGAQPDTVQHSIRTERCVNPLAPVYTDLDGDQMQAPVSPRYKAPPLQGSAPFEGSGRDLSTNQSEDKMQAQTMASSGSDERDDLITRLQNELNILKHNRPTPPQTSPIYTGGTHTNARDNTTHTNGGTAWRAMSAEAKSTPKNNIFSDDNLQNPGALEILIRPNSNTLGNATGGANNQLTSGRRDSERLVLRSSSGQPRVSLSAAERRMAREYHDDVDAVRDLKV